MQYPTERTSLNQLAIKHGSDKYGVHFYTPRYEQHFGRYRHRPLTFLEIGIGGYNDKHAGGASLRMWSEWFTSPAAKIIGIDIEEKELNIQDPRVHIRKGSQASDEFLASLINEFGPPDIILDDGSHDPNHVIASFKYLYPRMKSEGIYVVEDTQTSYWEGDREPNLTDPTHSFFKQFVEKINYAEIPIKTRPDYYSLHTTGLHFYHNLIILDKADNLESSNLVPSRITPSDSLEPLISLAAPTPTQPEHGTRLTVHLGNVGDVTANEALTVRGSKHLDALIQGFSLSVGPSSPLAALRYRVLDDKDQWSEFLPVGSYAGTRGGGRPICGYEITAVPGFRILSVGTFADRRDHPVIAGNGKACVPVQPGSGLLAMQLVIETA